MVNGQYNVEESKRMKDFPGAGKKFQKFKEKDYYVVWNLDDAVIRKILAHYNRINHFQNYV